MFGVQLERLWGSRFFLRYYFVAGVGAAVVMLVVSLLPFSFSAVTYGTVTIGASGAIYGLLMAFAIYYPETPILMFFLFPVPAKYFVMILGAIAFVSTPRGGGIAHVTHLGGAVGGLSLLETSAQHLGAALRIRAARHHGRHQVSLSQVEVEPPPQKVRCVLWRERQGLGPADPLRSSGSAPVSSRWASVCPSRYSMTRKSVSPSRPMSYRVQMCGWFNAATVRASRSNRCFRSGSEATCSGSTACHATRAAATSGRSCSDGRTVFFNGQAEGPHGAPDRRHTRGRGEGVLQLSQRAIRVRRNQRGQGV